MKEDFGLSALTQPLGAELFCVFFKDALPLPPPAESYYVESQDPAIFYVSSAAQYYIQTGV